MLLLAALVVVFAACNNNDPKDESSDPIKGWRFYCDNDNTSPYASPTRHYIEFGNNNDFEYGWNVYTDDTRQSLQGNDYETGTYELHDDYIIMNYTNGHFEVRNQAFQPRQETVYYKYVSERETIILTFEKGTASEYKTSYYKLH